MSGSDASKFSLKLTNSAKEHIKLAAQKTEQRLREEQKSVGVLSFNIVSNGICHFRKYSNAISLAVNR